MPMTLALLIFLGEGAFARVNISRGTVFAIYSGHLMNHEENEAMNKLIHDKRIANRWGRNDPKHLAQSKNK